MNFRNSNLVSLDYSFTVDTSELDTRLDEMQAKIDGLEGVDEDRVRELIEQEALDEDRAREIAQDEIRDSDDILGEDAVKDLVNEAIDDRDLVARSDIETEVENALHNRELADQSDVEALTAQVEALEARVEKALQVFDLLAAAVRLLQEPKAQA